MNRRQAALLASRESVADAPGRRCFPQGDAFAKGDVMMTVPQTGDDANVISVRRRECESALAREAGSIKSDM